MFWTLIASKRRIEQLDYFDWLSYVKNLVVSNGFEHVPNVIQWDQNNFFSKNLQKSPTGWGLCPQTPIATGRWGLRPHTPVCNTFEYTSLLNTSPKLDRLHFLTIWFHPLPLPKSRWSANRLQLQIFHSTISLPRKKFLFWKFLMTSLHMICGLVPPQSKILATPMLGAQ